MSVASRLTTAIELACREYEREAIGLPGLQQEVEPRVGALEPARESPLAKALTHFVARLEYIRFMYEANEQRQEVLREVARLRKALDESPHPGVRQESLNEEDTTK